MTTMVDATMMLDALNDVVRERGRDTKRQCLYVVNDAPYCIAACVLAKFGVTVEQLKKFGSSRIRLVNPSLLLPVALTREATDILESAQFSQDAGQNWGVALTSAKYMAELLRTK